MVSPCSINLPDLLTLSSAFEMKLRFLHNLLCSYLIGFQMDRKQFLELETAFYNECIANPSKSDVLGGSKRCYHVDQCGRKKVNERCKLSVYPLLLLAALFTC